MSVCNNDVSAGPIGGSSTSDRVTANDFFAVPPPAGPPGVSGSEVHLWRAELNVPENVAEALRQGLSPDEEERTRRVRVARDRRRLQVGRGILRRMLSAYTGIHPRALVFRYGPHGKPSLYGLSGQGGPYFSLSHSADLALLAIARCGPVGVDVERLLARRHAERVVRRHWTDREQAAFRAAPDDRKAELFLDGWTRKEACAKAAGEGIWTAAERYEVTLEPEAPARLLSVGGDPELARAWRLLHLRPAPGFVGALAVRSDAVRVSARILKPEDLA